MTITRNAVGSGANGRILIVEDEPDVLASLCDTLEAADYEVFGAGTARRGLDIAFAEEPDLVLLDLGLHGSDMDGRAVAAALRADPRTYDIPIVVLTGRSRDEEGDLLASGVKDFMQKPVGAIALRERVKAIIATRKRYRRNASDEYVITYSCEHGFPPVLSVGGGAATSVKSRTPLDLNPAVYCPRFTAALSMPDWRVHLRILGHDVYTQMFRAHPDILRTAAFYSPRNQPELASYRFQIPRAHVCLPFETLYDGPADGDGQYLALRHPMSRFLMGVTGSRRPLSRDVIEMLGERGQALKVLLIASNTAPPIPGVDAEIARLKQWIPERFRRKRIRVEITDVPTEKATLATVEDLLKSCPYHIVHYAGHGQYVEQSPEDSGLFFWTGPGRTGTVERLSATSLERLMADSATLFFYLSCCEGTTGAVSFYDDYLGVADALIDARIPSVLGYRRPVGDAAALKLAERFYAGLAEYGELDRALFEARRDIAVKRDERAWLTPVLIVQS